MQIITEADIDAVIEEVAMQDVRPASDWIEEVCEERAESEPDSLPWPSRTNGRFGFRPGELTIWAGMNGSGKSLIVGQAMLWLLPSSVVTIASMEMRPVDTLLRMCNQAAGCVASPIFKRGLLSWTGTGTTARLYVYDQTDTVPAERILAVSRLAATKLGSNHIVIDSLTKCGLPNSDKYDAQIRFVDRLQWVAKSTKAHIHLVAHVRKGDDEAKAPNKFDIRGAGEVSDLADNVLLLWRNNRKEVAIDKQRNGATLSDESVLREPDTFLRVAKQRHHSWEGTFGLWWHRESGQFVAQQGLGPQQWPAPGTILPWDLRAA
jgi:twinkle protein